MREFRMQECRMQELFFANILPFAGNRIKGEKQK
jgi:hypothetical protein